jgi:hypothetical protein
MKKYVILLLVFILFAGCSAPSYKEDVERPTGYSYIYTDFSIYSESELELRAPFEFVRMYKHGLKGTEAQLLKEEQMYGIEYYWRMNDYILFQNLSDMETMFSNPDFKEDYFNEYHRSPLDYYCIPQKSDARYIGISLITTDDKRYFSIEAINIEDDQFIQWATYDMRERHLLEEILSFYASLDDLTIERIETGKGYAVYYSPFKESTLFCAIEFPYTDKSYTAYIWEQYGVIGVMLLPGEHKPENLDLCVLEKHEL